MGTSLSAIFFSKENYFWFAFLDKVVLSKRVLL